MIALCRNLPFLTPSRQIFPLRSREEACLPESQTRCRGSFFFFPSLLSVMEEVEFMGKVGMRVRHNEEISM